MADETTAPAFAGAMEDARPGTPADHRDWLLMSLSSCLAAQTDLIEILRDYESVVPDQVYAREVVENLTCALQSAIGLAVQTETLDIDQRPMLAELQVAAARFLAAWA